MPNHQSATMSGLSQTMTVLGAHPIIRFVALLGLCAAWLHGLYKQPEFLSAPFAAKARR